MTLSLWPGLLHGRGLLQSDEHHMLNAGRRVTLKFSDWGSGVGGGGDRWAHLELTEQNISANIPEKNIHVQLYSENICTFRLKKKN